jgi:hypothetical protein
MMKKMIKWIGLIIIVIVILMTVIKITDYNSLVSRNTRQLEKRLSQNIENGTVRNLITFSYNKMYVFAPYQPLGKMEQQIGFKHSKLQQGINEGTINILFVNDSKAIAYLFGYAENTGYYINIPSGEYTKEQVDKMNYNVEKREVGNSYGTPKTYMNYEFVVE